MSGTPDIPGEGWYLAAGGAVLGGLVVAIALIAWLFLGRDEGTQFTAPGRVAVELRPGANLIWNDYRTTFEGTSYESPAEAPAAASVRVRGPGGAEIATRRSANHRFSMGKTDRSALLAFEAAQAGRHEIAVEGAFPPRVFSVNRDRVMRPFIATFGAFAALLLGLGAGLALSSSASRRCGSCTAPSRAGSRCPRASPCTGPERRAWSGFCRARPSYNPFPFSGTATRSHDACLPQPCRIAVRICPRRPGCGAKSIPEFSL